MDKLYLRPLSANYATQPPTEILRADLDGGAGRYRSDILGGSSIVTVSWNLNAAQYQYLWAFFRAKTGRGAEPFLMDLVLETEQMEERTCRFMPATLKLDSTQGLAFFPSAQLEVEAVDADDAFDNSLVDVITAAGGGDPDDYLNLFSIIVNENWPHT